MTQRNNAFIQLNRCNLFWELIKRRHTAYVLLTMIALRARRTYGIVDQLDIGEAFIGDCSDYGVTRQVYRSDIRLLVKLLLITIRTTSRGTIAKLCSNEFFDIHPEIQQPPDQLDNNQQVATKNNENNEKNEYIKENLNVHVLANMETGIKNSSVEEQTDTDADNLAFAVNVITCFFQKYRQYKKENHPPLNDEQYKNCVNTILTDSRSPDSLDLWEDYMDAYFSKKLQCDYHIFHFLSGGILQNLYYEKDF